jgi:NhaA family Na+:H+ antiporter
VVEHILSISDFFAADVLLTVFFFAIGLELVEEIVNGDLRDVKHASLPAVAALGGVLIPALIFSATIFFSGSPEFLHSGWAIPTATDVAFSLAVLSFFGSRLKPGVKLFLLVLAVVDDVIGIVIIAIAFSKDINAFALLGVVVLLMLWAFLMRMEKLPLPALIAAAVGVWACTYMSGIHPTIAGVLLGVTTPAKRFKVPSLSASDKSTKAIARNATDTDVQTSAVGGGAGYVLMSRAKYLGKRLEPLCNWVVVPVFAVVSLLVSGYELLHPLFSSADASGTSRLTHSPTTSIDAHTMFWVASAVTLALVFGKPLGIILFAWVGQHLTPLKLFHGLKVRNLLGVSALGGIGFTVSFLVASLSFEDSTVIAVARVGVLVGSVISALLGFIIIKVSLRSKVVGKKS